MINTKIIKKHYLLIVFLIFLIGLIFFTHKDYGVTWDENIFLQVGKHFVAHILDFLHFSHNLDIIKLSHNDPHLQSHGVIFDIVNVFLSLLFKNFSFETYHLLKALSSLPTFIFLYLIINKLFNKNWALLAVILLLLFPRFYGDIFNNSIDVPSITLLTIVIFSFLSFANSKKTPLQYVSLGLFSALLINQRFIFWYIFFLGFLYLFINDIIRKENFVQSIVRLGILTIIILVFMHLTNPYLLSNPVLGILGQIKTARSFPFYAADMFDGQLVLAYQLPWYYIPKLMFITIPLATIFLFIIGNFYLLSLIIKKNEPIEKKFTHFYLLLIFYLPLIIDFILRPTLYDSWRHFLFLTIPLIIISIYGGVAIAKTKNKILIWFAVILIGLNLLQTAWKMKVLHPYQYIYYNSLVGGLPGAAGKYETDYWGATMKEAVDWFNIHVNKPENTYYILANGDRLSSEYYFKKNMIFTDDYNKVKYIFAFTRWNFDKIYTGKIIYQVEREGVPLVIIKTFP